MTDGYLLADYRKPLAAPTKPRTAAALKRQREKLTNEIGDAETTLKWLRTEAPEALYPGTRRAEAMADIQQRLALLTQELEKI